MSGDEFTRRFEVVAETRRRWSHVETLAILKEASGTCVNVSAVARRHGIKPALLYRWRKEFNAETSSSMSLVPVVLDEPADDKALPAAPSGTDHRIEIALANGRTIKVPTALDATTLKRVISTIDN